MAILIMIKSTPLWVWLLLAFLIYRGIKALSPRTMTPRRMLVLPIVFFVWALLGIFFELHNLPIALPVFLVALWVGGALGGQLARRQPQASLEQTSGLIHRPGSPTTLVLVCIGFGLKYALSVFLARHPSMGGAPGFCAIYGAVSGIVDGTFWGVTAAQFGQALAGAGLSPSPAKLFGMALAGGRAPAGPASDPDAAP